MTLQSRSLFRVCVPLLLATVTFAGCRSSTSGSGDQPIVIKFPHVVAPSTPKGQAAARFEQLVEERFPGRVDIEVYPSSQLMNDDDSLEALAFGEVQMIAVSLSKFDRLTHSFQVFDLPFLFPDLEAVQRFQRSETGQEMLGELVESGFLGLGYWHNGMKHFGAPVAMRDPSDADGLKFRIMESDVLQAQVIAVGGNPQKMSFGEVYQALQTGAIDAQENTWSNIYSTKFHEVQNYFTITNHGYVGYLVAVNPTFWAGLPEDIRAGLEDIMDEVTDWENSRAAEINADNLERIRESGRTDIVSLTTDELDSWRTAMRPVWQEFEGNIGTDIIAAAQAAE
ncbi:MAG: TRAP transporter substrate-binding protein [Gammaproteobacteria bacterium]